MKYFDLTKLANLSYLIDQRPAPDSTLVLVLAILFALAIIGSGLLWFSLFRRERQYPILARVRERTVRFLFASGFVGLILVFFRWQGIPYFASRIWLLLWIVVTIVWLVRLLMYLLKKFPKERKIENNRMLKERYLPKSKLI